MSSFCNRFRGASLRHSALCEVFLPSLPSFNLPPRRETALHSALNKRTDGRRKRHPGAGMVKISIALPRSSLLNESHSWPMHPWKGIADFSNHEKKDRALNCEVVVIIMSLNLFDKILLGIAEKFGYGLGAESRSKTTSFPLLLRPPAASR